ncbi:MAG: fructosamine kinase family protein, partial [bacterium]
VKPDFWEEFARLLAELHKNTQPYFGLDHDNYIGSLVQSNFRHDAWTDFYREQRLEPQLRLAREAGHFNRNVTRAFDRFYHRIERIFPAEPPALLHGDLWSGNFMVNENGSAVIIDPAIYYGHREMDLGMSMLFGGFDRRFYSAYDQHFPLEPGWQERMDYCNLYPLLVHVNLFGGGYVQQVEQIIRRF